MKKQYGLLGMLLVGLSGLGYGQQWTGGVKGIVPVSVRPERITTRINEFEVFESKGGESLGSGWGLFTRYDLPRWYGQLEATYGRYYLTGLYLSSPKNSFGTNLDLKRQHIRLMGGYKPIPWLRLHAGMAGAFNQATRRESNESHLQFLEEQLQKYPAQKEWYESQLTEARLFSAIRNSYQRFNAEGQAGIGTDIGGLMLDLTYTHSLSPIINGVSYQGNRYAIQSHYGFWALSAAYRLFPFKAFLLQPRRNKRTYDRIKKTIPYYRNEVGVGVGITGDDFGGSWLYENRYTRYIHRRIGFTGVVGMARSFEDYSGFLPQAYTAFQFSALARFLPLYTRRHHLALSAGPVYTTVSGINPASGRGVNIADGKLIEQVITLRPDSGERQKGLGSMVQIDYQFMPVDRIPVGVWVRIQQNRALDYAAVGFQTGYRF
ncbi:hypothetical protein GCM10027347_04140 [Larkinella harenae]